MAKIKSDLYVGNDALDKAIKGIHNRGQSLQKEMHKVACSVLSHVIEHGDIRPLAKLLNAMPQSSRTNALRAWFENFGPVGFDKNDPFYRKGSENKRLDEARDVFFWDFQPEAAYKPVDVAKMLASMIAKLEKDEQKTQADHGLLINALETQLKALVPVRDTGTTEATWKAGKAQKAKAEAEFHAH